jgi:hypothetical protein
MIIILTALVTIPVYLTGEKAQGMIKGNYEDVDEDYIEPHEDFALYSFIAMDIVGAIGLLSMFIYRKPKVLPNSFAFFLLALLIVVNGMMAYTSHLGGKIHHPEMREVALPWESSTETTSGNDSKKADETKEDEDKDKDDDD